MTTNAASSQPTPERPFTIYVMQSAHTDIGYTHPQEQIALMYLEHYDRVLELCRQTEKQPIESRFKWTCETSWQVRHYLTARPEREEEFLYYVRSGQIEMTAAYLHFTDLIDADAYRRSLQWVVAYCRRHDLPLRCATHCDINGWPWGLADVLAEQGISFFCSHVHIDSATDPLGRRGSVHYAWTLDGGLPVRSGVPVRIPQGFWWQGPAGGRVLHWLNEHYHLGNALGLSSNKMFGADKTRYFIEADQATANDLYEVAQREVPAYVARLLQDGYPHEALMISTGGFYVDNSPPDDRWCQIIARWNAEHETIKLRTSTLGDWYDWLLQQETANWPVRPVAWPDHWAHGLGSMTARIAQARRTQRRRASAIALVAGSTSESARRYLEIALDQEILALEHTFDAWSTTARPAATANAFQQAIKEITFHRAELYLDDAIGAALRSMMPVGEGDRLHVMAPLGAPSATYSVHFDAGDRQPDPETHLLVSTTGEQYGFQHDQRELARFVAALPVGYTGVSGYTLSGYTLSGYTLTERATAESRGTTESSVADSYPPAIETAGWFLRVDPASGGLLSLRARATNREWVSSEHPQRFGFGQLVHEAVVHPRGREAVGNAARLIALGSATDELTTNFAAGPIVEHTSPTIEGPARIVHGPVFDAVELSGRGTRTGPLRICWRLYHALPLVELVLDWDKLWSDLPEAAYVAFPFNAPGGTLQLESSGGFFRAGSHGAGGQLPGTCSSYYTIQRAAKITIPDNSGLLWLPLDAPLVMPNAINYNNWETDEWAWTGFLASMPVNHYWHTNFPTSQRGPLRLRYRLLGVTGYPNDETAICAASPLDALGWR